jgi:hypothetical protein
MTVQVAVERPGKPQDRHCELPLDDGWTAASVLLPAIDQYGWLDNHGALSIRSISTITARRQDADVEQADKYPRVRTRSDAPTMSLQEVADAYDDLDKRVTALLLHRAARRRRPRGAEQTGSGSTA